MFNLDNDIGIHKHVHTDHIYIHIDKHVHTDHIHIDIDKHVHTDHIHIHIDKHVDVPSWSVLDDEFGKFYLHKLSFWNILYNSGCHISISVSKLPSWDVLRSASFHVQQLPGRHMVT